MTIASSLAAPNAGASSPSASNPSASNAGASNLGDTRDVRVEGKPYETLPDDLYIPPDALRVFLDRFEGPLDLLLYLIRRQNLDILDIPIFEITSQYMAYIEVMQAMRFELAGEYLVMAALLAEIKSRMLLPRPPASDEDDEDPRVRLLRQLQEYERFKRTAERLDALDRIDRDVHRSVVDTSSLPSAPLPIPELDALLDAMAGVMARARLTRGHTVAAESLSVRERMSRLLERLSGSDFVAFETLFDVEEGRVGVVVSFLAMLELGKAGLLEWAQGEPFEPIRLRRAAARDLSDERDTDTLLAGLGDDDDSIPGSARGSDGETGER